MSDISITHYDGKSESICRICRLYRDLKSKSCSNPRSHIACYMNLFINRKESRILIMNTMLDTYNRNNLIQMIDTDTYVICTEEIINRYLQQMDTYLD